MGFHFLPSPKGEKLCPGGGLLTGHITYRENLAPQEPTSFLPWRDVTSSSQKLVGAIYIQIFWGKIPANTDLRIVKDAQKMDFCKSLSSEY